MSKKYLYLFLFTIILIIGVVTFIVIFNKTDEDSSKDKIKEEIGYIETKLIGMLNSLNNIPFSNSVLLEKNSIKGQDNNNSKSNQESGGSEGSSGGSQDSQSSSEGNSGSSGGSTSSSSSSQSDSQSKSYTKYTVQSQNILIQSNNESIDWDYLKNSVEMLYKGWPTIMIDLHSANVKNDDILNFSNNLDNLILNIKNEDKRTTLNSLAILYSYIPIYVNQFLDDSDKINIAYTKSSIVNAYVLLEDDKWDDMQTEITKAQEYFGLIINSINEDKLNSSINKTYILLNETKNAVNIKDDKLFYLKYKNLMETALSI